jgi:peptidoglycan/xylan/chitin deacetylase (PgdA/CDA1 family)
VVGGLRCQSIRVEVGLNRLKFVLESRGIANTVERALQVAARFGLTAAQMEKRLVAYADLVAGYGSRPSLPMTARVLARNPRVARRLADRGVEMCVHGLVHTDLSRLPADVQAEQIRLACEIFQRHGIAYTGFRSPYLKYNDATLAAVAAAGFQYDSNLPFYWGPLDSLGELAADRKDGLERGLQFYRPSTYPEERSLPRFIGGVVEIPVSLPDDEILLDRMGAPLESLGKVWQEMAASALARGELLTLQLHPERFEILRSVLGRLLEDAVSGGRFWIATLGEIAAWWKERVELDVVVEGTGGGAYAVSLPRDGRAQVCVLRPRAAETSVLHLPCELKAPAIPLIGVHPDTPGDLRLKLREMGYYIAMAEDSTRFAAYLGPRESLAELERRVRDRDGQLLVSRAWPKPYDAAMAVTGDIDCLTLGDFLRRFREG